MNFFLENIIFATGLHRPLIYLNLASVEYSQTQHLQPMFVF
jgi:hypothetical protein